ncbi:maleylacetoacetate isomerase [Castellaniella sp. GW247-6E4]|uniref:maleylacetoacetate isomerase n=1 Tax=Castellaniella sp. GW247-6E4 TaxID=3140380 RepID=UPI00331574BB
MLELYSYFRSSAAYRVRIALGLKGLDCAIIPVHLLRDGGEQLSARYREINPESLVPALSDDGRIFTQSLAIIEYLDEAYGPASLLPSSPSARARVRALALHIACDIHPLNNLRVLRYLAHATGASQEQRDTWYHHWITTGFQALERQLERSPDTGQCCHGDEPGLADCCLIPQVFNARRYEIDLGPFPTIERIVAHCETIPAFQAAHPSRQPDAE